MISGLMPRRSRRGSSSSALTTYS
ncbi:MAG: DUF3704 domain-containing protein [Kiritimatiellae bacterium]|nr:DUF3704 domain-containing protein [Kiritimatiellia bacterium]MBQ3343039.1 DUF3704 domain-containing protein [Kiritimatiellia bacterium]